MPENLLVHVSGGHNGLALVAQGGICLVVLDDELADMTGLQFLRSLRQQELRRLDIIYITAQHTLELEGEVRRFGVLYYTEKPPDTRVMTRLAETVLSLAEGKSGARSVAAMPGDSRQAYPIGLPAR